MDASLNIAIAAEFDLCDKIINALELSELEVGKVSVVEIVPFDEEQNLRFKNKAVAQIATNEVAWNEFDYLLFAGDLTQAQVVAEAAENECVVLDLKGVCAVLPDVPVVVPALNEENLSEIRQRNIVSLADPQVNQLALALAPYARSTSINQVFVTSLLPASYHSGETVNELAGQTARLLNGLPLEEAQTRLAFDVFPKATANLELQLQKIFPQLNQVIFHQIQVPVFYGLAQQVSLNFDFDFDFEPNYLPEPPDFIEIHDSPLSPVVNGEQENGEDAVKLHLSQAVRTETGVSFWSVADEQRFNIAFLGVRLLESIYRQGY